MKLLIASNNQGKIKEIKKIFTGLDLELVTPKQIGIPSDFDPPETGDSFAANALIKAKAYAQQSGFMAMADDSGLIVDALDGRPGVYSRRYGPSDQARNKKLLRELSNTPSPKRTARFVSAICIYNPETGKTITAQGTVEGTISTKIIGNQGFGYDPVFIPQQYPNQTFAQLGSKIKNKISHRFQALVKAKTKLAKKYPPQP